MGRIRPVYVRSTITVGIFGGTITFFVMLATVYRVFVNILDGIVLVGGIVAHVVEQICMGRFSFARMNFLWRLGRFRVVAFGVGIFNVVRIGAFFSTEARNFEGEDVNGRGELFLVEPDGLMTFILTIGGHRVSFLRWGVFVGDAGGFTIFISNFNCYVERRDHRFYGIFIHFVQYIRFWFVRFHYPPMCYRGGISGGLPVRLVFFSFCFFR